MNNVVVGKGVLAISELKEVVRAYKRFDEFVVDVETKGPDRGNPRLNEVFWVSLAGPGRADVIPCGHVLGEMKTPAGMEKRVNPATGRLKQFKVGATYYEAPKQLWISDVCDALAPLFFSDRRKIGYNVKFDLESLSKYWDSTLPPPPYGDAYVAAKLIDENHPGYKLGQVVQRELGISYAKLGKAGPDTFPYPEALRYSYYDSKYTWLLWRRFLRQLEHEKVAHLLDFEMDLLGPIMRMEMAGAPVSEERLEDLKNILHSEIERTTTIVERANGGPINLNSDAQVAELVYEKRKHKCIKFTKKTNARSVDREALSNYESDPVVTAILEYSQFHTLFSTFVEGILARMVDGKLHTSFNQVAAVTSRLSSSEPNLQNIPARSDLGRAVRRCFVAPAGHSLVISDYSQIELRIAAHYTKDPLLVRAYEEGLDLHTITAQNAYGTKKPTPDQRAKGKEINFSVLYSVGPDTLARRCGISVKEAKQLISAFFSTYHQVRPWMYRLVQNCREKYIPDEVDPYVCTLLGRKRRLPQILWSGDAGARAERQAVNACIQGTAAEIMKSALIDIDRALENECPGTQLILTVHDEVVLCAPNDEAELAARVLQECMEDVRNPWTGKPYLRVPLVAEAKIVSSWDQK